MTKKPTQNFAYWLKVAVIGIALGLGLQFVRAWTEPTTAPPGGNVGAPINTSAIPQTKQGAINVFGYGSDHGIWATGSSYGIAGNDSDNGTWGALGYGGWGGEPFTVPYILTITSKPTDIMMMIPATISIRTASQR